MKKSRLRSPIPFIGGKFYIVDWVCSFFDYSCETYIELFGGTGVVLFNKKPHKIEIFNDINKDIINFFLVLRERPQELIEALEQLPYSREIHNIFEKSLEYEKLDNFERAVRWFYLIRSSFNGIIGSGFSHSFVKNMGRKYHSAISLLKYIKERIKNVQFECLDYKKLLEAIMERPIDIQKRMLIYADPPYFGKEDIYGNFTKEDHFILSEYLNKLQCKVVLSYYDFPHIQELYPQSKWKYFHRETRKWSQRKVGKTKDKAVEMILTNYDVDFLFL